MVYGVIGTDFQADLDQIVKIAYYSPILIKSSSVFQIFSTIRRYIFVIQLMKITTSQGRNKTKRMKVFKAKYRYLKLH